MKIVHIMPHQSAIHNFRTIRMFNDNRNYFPDEHIFIMGDERSYTSELSKEGNVVLEKDIAKNYSKFCKYVDSAECVFLHENTIVSTKILMRLGRKRLKKIIWCVWGHDLYPIDISGIKRRLSAKVRELISKRFYAIGIGFKYDSVEIRKRYGSIKVVYTPYGYVEGNKAMIDNVLATRKKASNAALKVLIGHSAYDFLNYSDTLQLLKKYKNENIKIAMVLAYGDMEYAKSVKHEALSIFGRDKIDVLDKIGTLKEYREYLASVDVCILNFKKQAALSNFYDLCYMEKKIYLARGGVLALAAEQEGMETHYVDDIKNESFEEFSKIGNNKINERRFGEFYVDEDNYLKMWRDTIDGYKRARNVF